MFAKIIFQNGSSPISLVLYRSLFSIPILFIINIKLKIDLKITKNEFKDLIYISIFGYAPTSVLLYLSYKYIPTGLATSLHFVYPVLVMLGSIVFYREKLNLVKTICTVLSTLGIFMFLNEVNIGIDNSIGIILAIGSGLTYAFYLVYLERSNLKLMPTFKMIFYLSSISSIGLFIYSMLTNTLTIGLTAYGWLMTVLFSHIVTIGAVLLLQLGVSSIGAESASILSTTEPITSVIIGILIFNEDINIKIIIGMVFIVLSVVLISINARNSARIGYKSIK